MYRLLIGTVLVLSHAMRLVDMTYGSMVFGEEGETVQKQDNLTLLKDTQDNEHKLAGKRQGQEKSEGKVDHSDNRQDDKEKREAASFQAMTNGSKPAVVVAELLPEFLDESMTPLASHFAQIYEDWPFEAGVLATALVVTSRADGVNFYKLLPGPDSRYKQHMGSWTPPAGFLTGSWDDYSLRHENDGFATVSSIRGVGPLHERKNYLHASIIAPAQFVAVEGQARYGNIFVVVAICKGSANVRPGSGANPCFKVRTPGSAVYEDRPILFVWDLNQEQQWNQPKPNWAIPLFEWTAALHVSLFVAHTQSRQHNEDQYLYAMVSSGFHQGMNPEGWAGQMHAPLIAKRAKAGVNNSLEPPQTTSSWAGTIPTDWEHPWVISDVTVASACDVANQRARTVLHRESERSPIRKHRVWHPEGVTVWQPPTNPYKTFVITAGVNGGVAVADFSEVASGRAPSLVNVTFTGVAWKQLVGRTWLKGNVLYAALADWANPGGLVIARLNDESGVPVITGQVLSESTKSANRIVLLDAAGKHVGDDSTALAVVPLQDVGKFAVYNILNPESPSIVAISQYDETIPHTYCLEAFPTGNGKIRVILMTAPADIQETSPWFGFDMQL